ncbi:MAG: hypothetical protein ABL921_05310 [Pirellula sp.]
MQSNPLCPKCNARLAGKALACSECGWTSRPLSPDEAFTICGFTLDEAFRRMLIDSATLERGRNLLDKLRESVAAGSTTAEPSSVPPAAIVTAKIVEKLEPPIPEPILRQAATGLSKPDERSVAPSPPPTPHALDVEYAPKVERPVRSWSHWLNAFMEEKNIQWGELVGGLMIVCCSIALVISFWSHIATRPWLKFFIFTGINAATLGLGLNAWSRWKLPTTSQGILMIGMLLLPLNFLAFAIFTLGMPWNGWTVVGEVLSLLLLGGLAWRASSIITPNTSSFATATVVGFALSNLLVRRFILDGASLMSLYVVAILLLGLYLTLMILGWLSYKKASDAQFTEAIRLLGLGTFGFLLAAGLVVGCSGNGWQTLHQLSPLATMAAFPALLYSTQIRKSLERGNRWMLLMISISGVGLSLGLISLLFAWPTPIWMTLSLLGIAGLLTFLFVDAKIPAIGYALYTTASMFVMLCFHVMAGRISWNEQAASAMWRTLLSPTSGFSLIGCSVAVLAGAVALERKNYPEHGRIGLRSAWYLGIAGLFLVGVFGLGRHEYATSVSILYLGYAISLIVYGAHRTPSYHDIVAGVFVVIASIQFVCFGWMVTETWIVSGFWATAFATMVLLTGAAYRIDDPVGVSPHNRVLSVWPIVCAGIATALAVLWLLESEWLQTTVPTPIPFEAWLVLSLIWGAMGCVFWDARYWTMGQAMAAVSGSTAIYQASKYQGWFATVPIGFLHPLSIQIQLAWLGSLSALFLMARWCLSNCDRVNTSRILRRLSALHQDDLAIPAAQATSLAAVLLCVYGALPGAIQELSPVGSSGPTQLASYVVGDQVVTRTIPDIARFEFPNFPHGAFAWNSDETAPRIVGLPTVLCLWFVALACSAALLWSRPSKLHFGIVLTVLMSILFPMASHWESQVAVASALRWLLGVYFVCGCAALGRWQWSQRNEQTHPTSVLTTAGLRPSDGVFWLLFGQLMVPNLMLSSIVVVGALLNRNPGLVDGVVWGTVGILGAIGAALLWQWFSQATTTLQRSHGENVQVSTLPVSIAAMLTTPLLAWLVLQIVLGLIENPLTSPNGNSWFATIGLANSYAIPILIMAAGVIFVAVARPSSGLAVLASQIVSLSVMVGYLALLKSNGLKPAAWVGLAALLCGVCGCYLAIWKLSLRQRSSLDFQQGWPRCLRLIATSYFVCGLAGAYVLVWLNGNAMEYLGWSVIGLSVSALILLATSHDWKSELRGSLGIVTTGIILAVFAATLVSNDRESLAVAGLIMLATSVVNWIGFGTNPAEPTASSGRRIGFAITNAGVLLLGLRELGEPAGSWWSVGLLSLSSLASVFVSRRSGLFRYALWAMATAHLAGFIYCFLLLRPVGSFDFATSMLLIQLSISLAICIFSSTSDFHDRIRFVIRSDIFVLGLMCFAWYWAALGTDMGCFRVGPLFAAILFSFIGSLVGYVHPKNEDANLLMYVTGLCCAIGILQLIDPPPTNLLWTSTLVFAAFCLASSFVWRASDRIRKYVDRFGFLPAGGVAHASEGVVVANTFLAMVVTGLGIASQFFCDAQGVRFATSLAIMAVGIAVGFLARYRDNTQTKDAILAIRRTDTMETTSLRSLALLMGVLFAVAFGWHFLNHDNLSVLQRTAIFALAISLTAGVYGFGLVKWLGLKQDWQLAALKLMPGLVGAAAGCVAVCVWIESGFPNESSVVSVCVALTVLLSCGLCLAAALLPGKDPLGLSENGRTVYVYAAEFLVLILVIHLRLDMPWLFGGWVQRIWPLVVIALSFGGLAASEFARRRQIEVLSKPLRRTGALLPLVPALAHWMMPSSVHYSASLLCAAAAYSVFGWLRRSIWYWVACIVFANVGLWYLLHERDFTFANYPQLWVIPPSMCILVFVQILRNQLTRVQTATARYMATSSIYVASTAELFLRGISEAPWMPIVLAALSIVGILFGIGARIRAMLWLGTLFLLVALFSMVWHAAVDLQQTWVWYAVGIVVGIVILFVFAMFEKRREELNRLVSTLHRWDD